MENQTAFKPLSVEDEMKLINQNYDQKYHHWKNYDSAVKGTLVGVKDVRNVTIRCADGNTLDVHCWRAKRTGKKVAELREMIGSEVRIKNDQDSSFEIEKYNPDLVKTAHFAILTDKKIPDKTFDRGMDEDFIRKAETRHAVSEISGTLTGLEHHGVILKTEQYGSVNCVMDEVIGNQSETTEFMHKMKSGLEKNDRTVTLKAEGNHVSVLQHGKLLAEHERKMPLDAEKLMSTEDLSNALYIAKKHANGVQTMTTQQQDTARSMRTMLGWDNEKGNENER